MGGALESTVDSVVSRMDSKETMTSFCRACLVKDGWEVVLRSSRSWELREAVSEDQG